MLKTILYVTIITATTACIDSPDGKCPIWPRQFSAPFGLHSGFPTYIKNATSMFYYKFTENGTQAQVVDYQERKVLIFVPLTHNTAIDTYLTFHFHPFLFLFIRTNCSLLYLPFILHLV